jgi:hypothetical protein
VEVVGMGARARLARSKESVESVLSGVAVVALAAGSGAAPSSRQPGEGIRGSQASATGVPGPVQLETAALALSDLPTGWTEGSIDLRDDLGEDRSARAMEEIDAAIRDFEMGDPVPSLVQALMAAADAEQRFATATGIYRSVSGEAWDEELEGVPATLRLEEIAGERLGDESCWFRLDAVLGGGSVLAFRVAIVRRGPVMSFFQLVNATTPGESFAMVPPEAFTDVVATADRKLARALADGRLTV